LEKDAFDDRIGVLTLGCNELSVVQLAFCKFIEHLAVAVPPHFRISLDLPLAFNINIWVDIELKIEAIADLSGKERVETFENQDLGGCKHDRLCKCSVHVIVNRFYYGNSMFDCTDILFELLEIICLWRRV
jgi:hypothetical protein